MKTYKLTPVIEKAELKIQEAEKLLAKGDNFMAKKTAQIAFEMATDIFENGGIASQEDLDAAQTWEERLGAFTNLFEG